VPPAASPAVDAHPVALPAPTPSAPPIEEASKPTATPTPAVDAPSATATAPSGVAPAAAPAPPAAPAADPASLGSPDGEEPAIRPGADAFVFATPRAKRVDELVAALRREGEPARAAWPGDLVRSVPAATALAKGERATIVVFHDDTARASRLAAADLWPVVLELEARVDLVLVDLTPGSRALTDDEKGLVRKYYLGYVPTTVVLSPERAARLLKPGRVAAADVKAAALASR
jgi:hypothetical protein